MHYQRPVKLQWYYRALSTLLMLLILRRNADCKPAALEMSVAGGQFAARCAHPRQLRLCASCDASIYRRDPGERLLERFRKSGYFKAAKPRLLSHSAFFFVVHHYHLRNSLLTKIYKNLTTNMGPKVHLPICLFDSKCHRVVINNLAVLIRIQ